MQNKIKLSWTCVFCVPVLVGIMIGVNPAVADSDMDFVDDIELSETISESESDFDAVDSDATDGAAAVADYKVEGSLFEQITTLEQEKVLMQLEKERAQLDLELDKLAAEKIKLHMEIDTLSGRAEQAQQELETQKARLEAEAASIARQKEELSKPVPEVTHAKSSRSVESESDNQIAEKYRLVNVVGAGNQLQATVEDLSTGQNKRLSVGKTISGYTVKSISLDEGVVFEKDGVTENLNISSAGTR